MSQADKSTTLSDAVALIRDGDQVAIGGHSHRRHPMALLYEVVRQGKKNLRLMGWNNGLDMDLLVGAGCVKQIQTSYVGMIKHGLARNFRRAAESGEIEVIEDSEITALARFRAGAMGVTFIPCRSPLGSDLMRFEQETREITCPFTGERFAALRAAQPDVALIHKHTADRKGNVQLDERYLQENIADVFIARSAKTVIASVEQLVETDEIMKHPERTLLPGFFVHAVVEAPYGAHPCACDNRYDYDLDFIDRYYEASKGAGAFAAFVEEYVRQVPSHEAYLDKVGLSVAAV